MKYEFLHKEDTGRLIIIFAGWSTDPGFYRHISLHGWDIMVVYDYTDNVFPVRILDDYPTVALFAWSLGVFMAARSIPFHRLSLAVAINGTETPVDDLTGIPVSIYRSTAEHLSDSGLRKFRMRMCGCRYKALEADRRFPAPGDAGERSLTTGTHLGSSGVEQLRKQLEYIESGPLPADGCGSTYWHRVYVSDNDRIFPPDAQKRAWTSHCSEPEIISLDEPHYVDLDPIIRSALPAKEKVGHRFLKALPTYDDQAKAQRTIAERLNDFPGGTPVSPAKVLEIGPGSGLFTRLFASRFHPQEIDFVDLYPLPPLNAAPSEHYFTADAEEWVASGEKERYDAIVSASAIQWFANPELFFRNASRLLRPGGFLLCSTFIPGNLAEMAPVNPYGLIYRRTEELEEMINRYFMFAKLEEEELIIRFESPMETLRHLKETGVGGGLATGRSPRELLASAPLTLTYRPLYIYAVKNTIHNPKSIKTHPVMSQGLPNDVS